MNETSIRNNVDMKLTEKQKHSVTNLSQFHFVYQKSHTA